MYGNEKKSVSQYCCYVESTKGINAARQASYSLVELMYRGPKIAEMFQTKVSRKFAAI